MCRPYTSLSRPIFMWFKQTYRQPQYLTDMIIKKKDIKNLSYKCENATMRPVPNLCAKKSKM